MVTLIEDDFKTMLAHPELVGMRTTLLPSQIHYKNSYSEYQEEYTYQFDKDGYVESCTIKTTEETGIDMTNYTFKWE